MERKMMGKEENEGVERNGKKESEKERMKKERFVYMTATSSTTHNTIEEHTHTHIAPTCSIVC